MLRKILCVILSLLLLCFLISCYPFANSSENDSPEETITFDLSQYKSHGNLSEGIIWVISEHSGWNTEPYETYAYLDYNGNIIYGWDLVGTYYNNGSYNCRATHLQDFKNGYALIYDQSGIDLLGGYAKATVIDKKGTEIAHFFIDAYESTSGPICLYYEDFNSDGYAFFIGKEEYDSPKGMFFINSTGVHKFKCNDNSYIAGHTLECIDLIDGKYLYVSWCNYQLFDLNGNLVMDIGKSSGIFPDRIKIINDKYIEAHFTGKDDKNYICVIDFQGEFIKYPVLASGYKRDPNLN